MEVIMENNDKDTTDEILLESLNFYPASSCSIGHDWIDPELDLVAAVKQIQSHLDSELRIKPGRRVTTSTKNF